MDFVIKLLVIIGYNSILVVCNRFSKMLYFIVITEKIIAKGLVKLFRDDLKDKPRAGAVFKDIHQS